MGDHSDVDKVIQHLKRTVQSRNRSFTAVSVHLGRPPDWLSKVLRGNRDLRIADLFDVLKVVEVSPEAFFAEIYDLYAIDQIGAEIVPGFFEGPVRRFVERIARKTAMETVTDKPRSRERASDVPNEHRAGAVRSRGDEK